jgi:hypothetical protein
MLALLFSSNYPGPAGPLWQYFGASLDHSILALCFGAFIVGRPDEVLSVRPFLRRWAEARTASSEASSVKSPQE